MEGELVGSKSTEGKSGKSVVQLLFISSGAAKPEGHPKPRGEALSNLLQMEGVPTQGRGLELGDP